MTKSIKKYYLKIILGILAILLCINFFLYRNYAVVAPGITVNLKEAIQVETGKKAEGSFLLTTISSRPLNIPFLIYALSSPYIKIEKKEHMLPPGWSMKEYTEYMKQWMEESQKIAEVVALRKAGYNPQIYGEGAQVVEIMEDSPAMGKLRPGDVIKKIDGKIVTIADEVVKEISKRPVGDKVNLNIKRDGKIFDIIINTIESKTEKGKTIIGVYITTLNWKPILPLKINIETGDIGGPSAGSMFTMEILNQLTPEDLTCGKRIAGTGTISLDEQIGEIGGVEQKVLAAYRDKAEIFFVPEKNAQDAQRAAKNLDIVIVPVNKLDDIIDYLSKL